MRARHGVRIFLAFVIGARFGFLLGQFSMTREASVQDLQDRKTEGALFCGINPAPRWILAVMATAAFQSIIPSIVPFRFPPAVQRLVARALGIEAIERVYIALQSMGRERSIVDRLLDFLAVSYTASDVDLLRIPKTGSAIVTVNHPFGILEGAILASLLKQIRPDVRFLANGILSAIPEVREMVIPVDPISGPKAAASNGRGVRRSLEHIANGGMLVIFPAGEVSHFRWKDRAVADAEWNPAVARMARISGAPVIPAYVSGANSLVFQMAGLAASGVANRATGA